MLKINFYLILEQILNLIIFLLSIQDKNLQIFEFNIIYTKEK